MNMQSSAPTRNVPAQISEETVTHLRSASQAFNALMLLRSSKYSVLLFLFTSVFAAEFMPGSAHAQIEGGVNLDAFRSAETPEDGFALSRPNDLGHLRFGVLATLDYANDPLVLEINGDEAGRIVEHHLVGTLGLSFGLFDRLVLFAGLQSTFVMEGDNDPNILLNAPDADGSGYLLGDVYFGARLRIFGENDDLFGLGVQVTGTAPTADAVDDEQDYVGDDNFTVTPEILLELRPSVFRITANVGARIRDGVDFADVDIGHELVWGLGVTATLIDDLLDAHVESYGTTVFEDFSKRRVSPVEVIGGLKLHVAGFALGAAAGAGLQRGYGSPDVRGILSLGYATPKDEPEEKKVVRQAALAEPVSQDRDNDGLLDEEDDCPLDPEDVDGFEDADGCPDPDNDKDGVLDVDDGAPLNPEDIDEFEDQDGVPDPDNDEDGLMDEQDRCPLAAEDIDGFQDEDGCPDSDNDGDTILDADDECPLAPGKPEDKGCPKSVRVDTEKGLIVILERVEFATNKDRILKRSEPILEEVYATIAANPQIKKMRVEGHTDSRGSNKYNTKLSSRRARSVIRWLRGRGIDAERLEATGCGESLPIDNNKTRAGRQNNRRVEFHIVDPAPPAGAERSGEECQLIAID